MYFIMFWSPMYEKYKAHNRVLYSTKREAEKAAYLLNLRSATVRFKVGDADHYPDKQALKEVSFG